MNSDDDSPDRLDELEQRLHFVERMLGVTERPCTPGFDPLVFHSTFMSYYGRLTLLVLLLAGAAVAVVMLMAARTPAAISQERLFGLPLFVTSGQAAPVSLFGLPVGVLAVHGIGLISVGGLAVGFLAVGGGAVGVVAIGGGAVGLIAFGGGAIGLLAAFGGGAIGYIAVGGGAFGVYVLAGDGKGRHVFDRRRQDPVAVEFFCRWMPRLRTAFAAETPGR
jgi:hypothetical protein